MVKLPYRFLSVSVNDYKTYINKNIIMRTTFFILILSILSAILNTGCQKEDVSTLEESLKGKEFINCEYGVILERSPYDSRVCKREYRYLNITFNDDYTYTAPIELFNYPYGWTIPSHESSGVWSIENGVLLIDGHIMYGYANTGEFATYGVSSSREYPKVIYYILLRNNFRTDVFEYPTGSFYVDSSSGRLYDASEYLQTF